MRRSCKPCTRPSPRRLRHGFLDRLPQTSTDAYRIPRSSNRPPQAAQGLSALQLSLGRDVQSHHTSNSCSRRRLVRIGELMPGTFPVCATLKSELSEEECNRIRELSVWGREPDAGGHCRNPMIVLTGTELFAQFNVQTAWQESEGQRKNLASVGMSKPWTLADLTQQAYLGLPPTYQWLWGYRDRRSQQRGSGADYVDRPPDEKGTVPR